MGNQQGYTEFQANYTLLKMIQDPRYGEGRLMKSKSNDQQVFMKVLNIMEEEEFKKCLSRLENRVQFPHTNTINLLQILHQHEHQFCGNYYKIYLLFDYFPQTLQNLIDQHKLQNLPFTENELWTILQGIISGLVDINIPHQGLQPKTISIRFPDRFVKISDPSLINFQSTFAIVLSSSGHPDKGCYLSPQQMRQAVEKGQAKPQHAPQKSDIFSIGVIMMHAMFLEPMDCLYQYNQGRFDEKEYEKRVRDLSKTNYSIEFLDLVRSMVQYSEDLRPTLQDLHSKLQSMNIIYQPSIEINQKEKDKSKEKLSALLGEFSTHNKDDTYTNINNDYMSKNVNAHTNMDYNSQKQVPISYNSIQMDARQSMEFNLKTNDLAADLEKMKSSYQIEFDKLKLKQEFATNPIEIPTKIMGSGGSGQINMAYSNNPFASVNQQPNNFTQSVQKQQSTGYNSNINDLPTNVAKLTNSRYNLPVSSDYVIETYQNGSKYEGEKLNNMRHGKGKFFFQDGALYDGDWSENKMHGTGTLYYASGNIAYQGQWVDDKFQGQGILYNESPQILNGMFDYANFDQIGDVWTRYEGNFRDDNKEGQGVLYLSNKEKFEGNFVQDLVCGPGRYFRKNGHVVEGYWWKNILRQF